MSTSTIARTKTVRASIKSTGADEGTALEDGQFRALVSVFNNVDSYGERVTPGAFTDTLKDWETRGDPIPVIWSHDWGNPFAHIGHVVKATETDDGLEVIGQLDVEDERSLAAQVYRLMKGRRVTQFSFAYDVTDGGWVSEKKSTSDDDSEDDSGDDDDEQDVYELRALRLHEVGPCLLGVNQSTELLDIKALVRDEVVSALARSAVATTISGAQVAPAKQGSSSQVHEPRDGAPAPTPAAPAPPRMHSASVLALIDTQLPEGIN